MKPLRASLALCQRLTPGIGLRLGMEKRTSKVATPVFAPSSGEYDSFQSVSITASTPDAAIRFTTDGSDPTQTHGTIYSGPISVESSETIKAIAYKSPLMDSDVAEATYSIVIPWTPEDLPNLIGWLDGADDSTKHVDGSNVLVQWDDKGPRGINGVPQGANPAPTLVAGALAGKSLFLQTGSDRFKLATTPMPFPQGNSYTGPMFEVFVLKIHIPTSGDFCRIMTLSGTGQIYATDAASQQRRLTSFPGNPEINQISNAFTNCRPIMASLASYCVAILVNSYGAGSPQAKCYFFSPSQGDITSYFSTRSVIPFVHDLWIGDPGGYQFGEGSSGAQDYLAEYIISNDQPAAVDFNGARAALISKWMGVLRPQILFSGDSLTYGLGLTRAESYPAKVAPSVASFDCLNVGLSSETISLAVSRQAEMATVYRYSVSNKIVVWLGTNDISANTYTVPQDLVDALAALCDLWTASGFTVYVADIIPRGTFTPTQETMRQNTNSLLLSQSSNFSSGLAQLSAQPEFSSASSVTNPTYYNVDEIHLTAAGYTVVASVVASAIS